MVTVVFLVTLAGCGGGGSSSQNLTPPAFDSTEFQGTWKRNDQTSADSRANCFSVTEYGGNFGGLNRPVVITDTTITQSLELYSDRTCATYSGLLVLNYAVTWSAGSVAGKTNVARSLVTSTGFTTSVDGGTGFTLSKLPVSGIVTKALNDVIGPLLYIGVTTPPADADGYPTTLPTTALYSR